MHTEGEYKNIAYLLVSLLIMDIVFMFSLKLWLLILNYYLSCFLIIDTDNYVDELSDILNAMRYNSKVYYD